MHGRPHFLHTMVYIHPSPARLLPQARLHGLPRKVIDIDADEPAVAPGWEECVGLDLDAAAARIEVVLRSI